MAMDALFPAELAKLEAPPRFRVAVDVPVPQDGRLRVPSFMLDVIAAASLSCPDLLGAATAELVQVWADGIGEERVPSMSAMVWAVARRTCGAGAMRRAKMTVEPVTLDVALRPVYRLIVSKGTFFLVSAVVLLVAWAGWHATGLALAALGLGGSYYVSIRLHPRTRHTNWFRGCGGTGEHKGTIFGWGHRRCPYCDSGRLVRWGAGQFGSPPIREEYVRRKAARAAAREDNRWR